MFKLLESTRKVVDVSEFHPNMPGIEGIQIGTVLTVIDLVDRTTIGVFHEECLYYMDPSSPGSPVTKFFHDPNGILRKSTRAPK